jgi:BirA family biotin operon repressor/biotin-[acetyl-CoA-carboxylase] ligase
VSARDLLLPEKLNPLLRNSIFFGNIHHSFEVESTNFQAAEAASASKNMEHHPEGEAFLAEEQTAGRGRGSHAWSSERGAGIYCSSVVRPQITPADALWLSLLAGVAVQDAVREVTGLSADIRWPNDLLISEKKFCGILAELSTEANHVNYAVVGIGINVNHGAFPEELRALATSLRLESGKEWSRVDLTAALLKSFDREYRGLMRAVHSPIKIPGIQFGPLLKKVEARSSYAYGKRVHVNEDGGYSGTTDGLDPRGFLRVRTNRGLRIVISGSVRPLPGRRSDAAGR